MTTEALAEPLLARVPRLQNTTEPMLVQPPGALPETKLVPAGSWLEITTPVASAGPRFVTWKVSVSGAERLTVAGVLVMARVRSTRLVATQQSASDIEIVSTYHPPPDTEKSLVSRQRNCTDWPAAPGGRFTREVMKPPELPRQLDPLLYPPCAKFPPALVMLMKPPALMEISRVQPSQQDSVL